MKRPFLLTLFVTLLTVSLAACGGREASPDLAAHAGHGASAAETPAATPAATPAPQDAGALSGTIDDGVRTLVITPVGNEMQFAQTDLTVEAGETIRLVFENTATSPAMQHNVVVVTGTDAIDRVGQAAMAVGGDYVPDDEAVIAGTPLAQPGQTVDVTFTAPETPGDYAYICTFPGHYMMMQGTLHVVSPSNV